MPTTFNVIPLGVQALIDPTEGNTSAENAAALVGLTVGSLTDPLWEQIVELTPGSTGFAGGTATAYDMNNTAANETFRIDGGPEQTFDGTSVYNATITYVDGTTATITAVIFQDTAGNTYLAPEFSANADQAALQAAPIRSLSLDSLSGSDYSGMTGSRETFNFMVCFAAGTLIDTGRGPRPVENLRPGDLIRTRDNGLQLLRWHGARTVPAQGPMAPIRIAQGALGPGIPDRDLLVSPQHRVMLRTPVAVRMFGAPEVLVAATHLTGLPGITRVTDRDAIRYCHFMLDRHEIAHANGAPLESLHLGPEARRSLGAAALAELLAIFPDLAHPGVTRPLARPVPRGHQQRRLIARIIKNRRPALEAA